MCVCVVVDGGYCVVFPDRLSTCLCGCCWCVLRVISLSCCQITNRVLCVNS